MGPRRITPPWTCLQVITVFRKVGSLPDGWTSGIEAEANLSFIDQLGNQHPLKVDLLVIRDTKNIKPERPAQFRGLYAPSTSSESIHGLSREKPDLGGGASISSKEPNAARANRTVHNMDAPNLYRNTI
jgi:hypothetical protein